MPYLDIFEPGETKHVSLKMHAMVEPYIYTQDILKEKQKVKKCKLFNFSYTRPHPPSDPQLPIHHLCGCQKTHFYM